MHACLCSKHVVLKQNGLPWLQSFAKAREGHPLLVLAPPENNCFITDLHLCSVIIMSGQEPIQFLTQTSIALFPAFRQVR